MKMLFRLETYKPHSFFFTLEFYLDHHWPFTAFVALTGNCNESGGLTYGFLLDWLLLLLIKLERYQNEMCEP